MKEKCIRNNDMNYYCLVFESKITSDPAMSAEISYHPIQSREKKARILNYLSHE